MLLQWMLLRVLKVAHLTFHHPYTGYSCNKVGQMTKIRTKSLLARQNILAKPEIQLYILSKTAGPDFNEVLESNGLGVLNAGETEILQINLGYMCNLACEHCHVDAGPDRKELMSMETLHYCLRAIDNSEIDIVDLTGGAPEMHPDFVWFIKELARREVKIIVRSNLTILVSNQKYDPYIGLFAENGVEVIASLPCYTASNTDKQRGDGVFSASLKALKKLNEAGYGKEGSPLQLNLVYNPLGASLPGNQLSLEQDYKAILAADYGIVFNNLYSITNLPVSRFLDTLVRKGKLNTYMQLLIENFNPAAVNGVMCRNTVSVSWKGELFDCDFNQMLDLGVTENYPGHIKDFMGSLLDNRKIATHQHCFGCTAGAGSSCQGALIT